jgi:hypothetical protein
VTACHVTFAKKLECIVLPHHLLLCLPGRRLRLSHKMDSCRTCVTLWTNHWLHILRPPCVTFRSPRASWVQDRKALHFPREPLNSASASFFGSRAWQVFVATVIAQNRPRLAAFGETSGIAATSARTPLVTAQRA